MDTLQQIANITVVLQKLTDFNGADTLQRHF